MPFSFKYDYLCADIIPHHARYSGGRTAVISGEVSLTWVELERRTRKIANALIAAGIAKGDKVCMYSKSTLAAYELTWGIIRAGAVVVGLNTMVTGETLATLVNRSDGKLLFADSGSAAAVAEVADSFAVIPKGAIFAPGGACGFGSLESFLDSGSEDDLDVEIDPEDSICIIYSSGSTGVPKGIELSHRARQHYLFGQGHWGRYNRESVALVATPLYTSGTWFTMAPCMYWGGTCVLMDSFDACEFIRLAERHRVTHVFLVPTQTVQILNDSSLGEHDLTSLRLLLSGGQALMPQTFVDVGERLPGAELWDCYGMSEGFVSIVGPLDYALGKRGSVGKPMFMDDIRIIDGDDNELPAGQIGEICAYSVGQMKGYYKDPAATEEAIWYGPRGRSYIRSGDLGRFDEDGYLFLCGRAKDMIKSGGINVFPPDIEAAFTTHPAVSEAAVIGIPHEKWMETPLAYVILRPDAGEVSPDEIKAWANEKLAKYQRVSEVRIVADFPRVTYGKVDKKKLRAPFWPTS